MFGVPRLRASTLMCESGVWKSWEMIPAQTEMLSGDESSTTMSRKPT